MVSSTTLPEKVPPSLSMMACISATSRLANIAIPVRIEGVIEGVIEGAVLVSKSTGRSLQGAQSSQDPEIGRAISKIGWPITDRSFLFEYRRAFFDDGTPLGSAANDECRIDSIAQSWAVISGAGDPVRARRAMAAVEERLVRRDDRLMLLFSPPFVSTRAFRSIGNASKSPTVTAPRSIGSPSRTRRESAEGSPASLVTALRWRQTL